MNVRNELFGHDLVCLDSPFKSKADYNVLFRGDRNRELSGQYLMVASGAFAPLWPRRNVASDYGHGCTTSVAVC
jgi:hypothetical protein